MATAIQRRRGNTAQHASFTGLAGEITIDTDKNTVVVHDGTTAGGFPLATASDIAALGGADITAVVAGSGLTGGATSGNATINIGAGAGITVNADNVAVNTSYYDVTSGGTGWTGNLEPSANNTYSLGSATNVWKDVFVGPNSIRIGGVALSLSNGVLQFGGSNVAVAGSASSNADTRALFTATDAGGDGSFSYNSSTGVFTYTGPSQAEANTRIDARLSGTGGITYNAGAISVNQGYFDKTAGGTGFAANFEPSANNTYSLGSINNVWKDVYVGPGSLYVNGQQVLSDNSGTITVSADAGQNLSLVTTSGGDLELNSNTGDIQLKSNITVSAGKTITASGGLKLASNLDVNSQYINNLTNPVQAQDAATKHYVDNDSSVVRVTGAQSIAGVKTFTDAVVISGNLTVGGTTTTVNSETISLADNIIDLNSNFTSGTPTENAGLRIKRGDSADVQLRWNEADDKWQFTNDGSTYQNMLSDSAARGLISVTDAGGDGSLAYNNATGEITYTGPSASEVRAHFSAGTGVTLSNGQISIGQAVATSSNVTFHQVTASLIGNVTGTVSSLSNHDTGDLVEGANLYFTAARARGNISVTDNGGDGSLSYDSSTGIISYTGPSANDVRAHFTGGDGLTYSGGTFAVGAGAGIIANADNVAVNSSYITSLFSATDAGGDGSFNYSGGVFTYTGPSQAEANTRIDARLSGTNGVSYSGGVISLANTTAGAGLTFASGVLAVGAGTGITVNADDIALSTSGVTAGVYGSATQAAQITIDAYGRVTSASNVTLTGDISEVVAGNGLVGGGSTGSVTLNVAGGYGITVNADSIELSNTNVRALFSGSSGVDYNSTTGAFTLASGTAGGGLTHSSGVLAVGAGNYITVAADSVAVDATTTATASKVAARDSSGDLYANIFQGTASSARYADLAERYEADAILEPGTVVCFGGAKEITACDHENDHAVAGVVSTDPAYMMNSAAGNNDTHPYIALTGRVPVKVVGPVAKGDLLVASGVKGHAMVNNNAKAGTIIGKAIGSSDSGEGVVEALINLM